MAGVLKVTADVEAGGPIFDGAADHLLDRWANDTARDLADKGVDELRSFVMDKTGRAAGEFQQEVKAQVNGPVARIPGPMISGRVWSPWLEGTSRRNESTGFSGYRLFRKTRLDLQRAAVEVGERNAERIIAEMGGP